MLKILAILFFIPIAWAQKFEPPPLREPIADEAQLITNKTEHELNKILRNLWQSGGSQIAVLTVESLNGTPIETASIQIVEKWKLGSEKGDNGVLLLVSKGDRSIRIEVGQGLEGQLTDLYSKRIIEDVMVPRFRSGDFELGIVEGIGSILKHTDPDVDVSRFEKRRSRRMGDFAAHGIVGVLIFLLFRYPYIVIPLIIFFLILGRGGRRRSFWSGGGGSGGFGGGSFGGGSFGGGFGGGGGGFSGGGASGRW